MTEWQATADVMLTEIAYQERASEDTRQIRWKFVQLVDELVASGVPSAEIVAHVRRVKIRLSPEVRQWILNFIGGSNAVKRSDRFVAALPVIAQEIERAAAALGEKYGVQLTDAARESLVQAAALHIAIIAASDVRKGG